MEKKNVLVLGASRGIGESITRYLSAKGYFVIMVATSEIKLKEIHEELPETTKYIVCDLSKEESVKEVFDTCAQWDIKLDGMVYCAGICELEAVKFNTIDVLQKTMMINTMAFVECGKYFAKKKYANAGASIVAVSSMSAEDCTKGMCAYSMSKSAMNTAVKVMAKEFAGRKVRVNAVMPAYVNTEMTVQGEDKQEVIERLTESQPLGVIEPEYVAYAVEFLLSDKTSYVTGSLMPITGGRTQK